MTGVLDDAAGDTAVESQIESEISVVDGTPADVATFEVVIEDSALPEPASWLSRVGAFSVDVLLGAGVVIVFMLVAWSAPLYSWLWWLAILVAALVFFAIGANRLVLPVVTGWSLGRSLFGIAVMRKDGRPIDPWFLLLRDLAHLLDTIPLCFGWFWPLVDRRRRTFADIVTGTEVCPPLRARPDFRKLATALVAGMGVLALLGATLGYFAAYRHDATIERARKEIAMQGPKIVPDVLSYSASSADADFAQAQALVTDSYRPQLVAQQDAVRKAGPIVDNEYWVTNSAVLSATADHAEMLLLMQGQRGVDKKQRFITATVRAAFQKAGSGQWQLANLTVLAKPQQPQQPPASGSQAPPASGKPAPPASGSQTPPASGKPAPSQPGQSSPTSQPNPPKQGR